MASVIDGPMRTGSGYLGEDVGIFIFVFHSPLAEDIIEG
jgi:hypothetical protein